MSPSMINQNLHKKVVALDRVKHRDLRIDLSARDLTAVNALNAFFVAGTEFTDACKEFPVVWVNAGEDEAGKVQVAPIAVFGLKEGQNLCTDADGWRVRYVPVDRWLAPAEFELLLEHLCPKRRLWALAAVYTGARRSELQNLQWQGIDWTRGLVRIRGTKTKGSHRLVPLHPRLAAELQPHKRDLGPVLSPWENAIRDLAVACKACGLQKCTPNDLRRTFASWLKQAGQDSFVVAQLLGHSSSRMVELVYGRLDTATLAAAVSHLPNT